MLKNLFTKSKSKNLSQLKTRLKDHGGKWMGFKLGKNDEIIVRIRRNNKKHFYLLVKEYLSDNKIIIYDPHGKEKGVAIRFNKDSFELEPGLK